jgi:hypothetical protein
MLLGTTPTHLGAQVLGSSFALGEFSFLLLSLRRGSGTAHVQHEVISAAISNILNPCTMLLVFYAVHPFLFPVI